MCTHNSSSTLQSVPDTSCAAQQFRSKKRQALSVPTFNSRPFSYLSQLIHSRILLFFHNPNGVIDVVKVDNASHLQHRHVSNSVTRANHLVNNQYLKGTNSQNLWMKPKKTGKRLHRARICPNPQPSRKLLIPTLIESSSRRL